MVICLEPLNRFETSFLNLSSQVAEVVDQVDSPGCAMMLDTFHMNIEERNSGDAIRLAGKRLKHIHTCESDRGAPGTGQVHWDQVPQAIKDSGYNGPLVIESFTPKVKSIARAAAIGARWPIRPRPWPAKDTSSLKPFWARDSETLNNLTNAVKQRPTNSKGES